MKRPDLDEDDRRYMFDVDCQIMEGVPFLPQGIRLDKRVQRPRSQFYTSQRAGRDGDGSRGAPAEPEKKPFLPRNTRDRAPVPSAMNHERPKSKKYK